MNEKILSIFAKALNSYLDLDPESRQRLAKLNGQVITIELLPFHFIFQCKFEENGIYLHQHDLLPAETRITGTPLQLMTVSIMKNNRQRFFAEDVVMEGNAELGHEVIALFDDLQIDWEEYLSHLIGDIPAHHAGRMVRGMKSWLKQAADSFTANVDEYVHEEKNWLPSRETLQDFFNDIDSLRMDLDRTAVKMAQLESQLIDDKETP